MALRRLAIAPSFTNSFLSTKSLTIPPPHHHRFLFPPLRTLLLLTPTRTYSSSSGDKAHADSPVKMVQGSPQEFKMENPFQSGGPGNVIEVDEVKEGVLVRVTLPGVGENGIKVWVENNTLYFAGSGDIEIETDECGRKYGGSLEFPPEEHRADGFSAEMKNGVLRILVPNAGSRN